MSSCPHGGRPNRMAGCYAPPVRPPNGGAMSLKRLGPSGTREEGHDDAPVIGIAMDGHVIRRRELADGSVPADLDACGGHAPDGGQYHYHAGAPGMNRILGCLTAQHGCSSPDPGMACDATRPSTRP